METAPGSSATRSVVLVHGAWHGAWCWNKVADGLAMRGVRTTAVELPFTGTAADVEAARAAIEHRSGAVVVVGHSYGGAVISRAASALPTVMHLVYLCAFMLDEDERADALMAEHPSPLLRHLRIVGDRRVVDPAGAVEAFYGDCSATDVETALPRLRPTPVLEMNTVGRPAWRDVPSTYAVCTEDRAIVPDLQRHMARHATHVIEWATSHSPFLSQPALVVELLERLARR